MTTAQKLIEQAERAERLARQGFDVKTTDSLLAAAFIYRERASALTPAR